MPEFTTKSPEATETLVQDIRIRSIMARRSALLLLGTPLLAACTAAKASERKLTYVPVLTDNSKLDDTVPITGGLTPGPTETPRPTATPRPIDYSSFPEEMRPIVQKLAVPEGLYLFSSSTGFGDKGGNCDGRYSPGNYNIGQQRVELYNRWDTCLPSQKFMLFIVTHETAHSHQHRMIINAGLANRIGAQPNVPLLQPWLDTEEGKAFMAAGGRSNLRTNPAFDPTEDYANIFAAYYWNRGELRSDSKMYAFAQNTFPSVDSYIEDIYS